MAEESLTELVVNLINWIEWLHEKNLKYQAQVESLTKDLAKAQSSKEELETRLAAYQNSDIKESVSQVPISDLSSQVTNTIATHPHQQSLYHQPIPSTQTFPPQPAYVWTYDTSGHDMQVPYYEQYGASAFQP